MGLKAALSKPFAKYISRKVYKEAARAVDLQDATLKMLLEKAKNTAFGKDHGFAAISNYEDFKKAVPVQDYEGIKKYIERIKHDEENVLWPGLPMYFSKTSGTTSGVKYIPISKDSMGHHITAARNAILLYIAETGKAEFVDGKMIFLQGSPELDNTYKTPTGRLSGITAHHVPKYLQKNRKPSYATNCIGDWETKLDAIIDETINEDMRVISGIPPWVQMYFERIHERTGKTIAEVFPNFTLFVQGGVNYRPYQPIMEKIIGKSIPTVEVYPASEGFIAFQDSQKHEGLLLNTNAGIFFEFIPADEYFNEKPTRISLKDVKLGVNYAIVLNTNAGLFGYNIGDTVKFVSTAPHRIVVTGRIKHFISAFGEHVIGEEVDRAMIKACEKFDANVTEFTVAPQVAPSEGLPYHEWFVEFSKRPADRAAFTQFLNEEMVRQNVYYKDLIRGNILRALVLTEIGKEGFIQYMKSQGKLGGQNKVPRLGNDRNIADALAEFKA